MLSTYVQCWCIYKQAECRREQCCCICNCQSNCKPIHYSVAILVFVYACTMAQLEMPWDMRIELIAIMAGTKISPKLNFEDYISAKKTHCNFVSCYLLQKLVAYYIRLACAHLLRYLLSHLTHGNVCSMCQTTLHKSFRIFYFQNTKSLHGSSSSRSSSSRIHTDIAWDLVAYNPSFLLFDL